MTIESLLNKYNTHYPNSFDDVVKLDWINEIEGLVCAELNKNYGISTAYISPQAPIITLPDGVYAQDIESVTLNGIRIAKADLRSHDIIGFKNTLSFGKNTDCEVTIVYLINHKAESFCEGDYSVTFKDDTVVFADTPPFNVGDTIEISGCLQNENNVTATVMSVSGNTLTFNRAFSEHYGQAHLRRVLDKPMRALFPYDKLYLEYLIAKGDLYNRDYDAYRNDMLIFNTTWMGYSKYLKQRAPKNLASRFKNYW